MAKKKTSGVNKSQAVRNALASMPHAPASEIAAAASKECGEPVMVKMVYKLKSAEGRAKKAGKKKPAAKRTAATPADDQLNIGLIREAATLLKHAGDASAARQALNTAEEILQVLKK